MLLIQVHWMPDKPAVMKLLWMFTESTMTHPLRYNLCGKMEYGRLPIAVPARPVNTIPRLPVFICVIRAWEFLSRRLGHGIQALLRSFPRISPCAGSQIRFGFGI